MWEYLNRPDPTAAPVKTSLTAEDLERRLQTGVYNFTKILSYNQVKDWNDLLQKGVDKPIVMNDYILPPETDPFDEIDEEMLPF